MSGDNLNKQRPARRNQILPRAIFINFITKKNFEGLQLDAQLGGNWHDNNNGFAQQRLADAGITGPTGTSWDGQTVNASITLGANILEGRGNVTGYFGYQSIDPVKTSRCGISGAAPGEKYDVSTPVGTAWMRPPGASAASIARSGSDTATVSDARAQARAS